MTRRRPSVEVVVRTAGAVGRRDPSRKRVMEDAAGLIDDDRTGIVIVNGTVVVG